MNCEVKRNRVYSTASEGLSSFLLGFLEVMIGRDSAFYTPLKSSSWCASHQQLSEQNSREM